MPGVLELYSIQGIAGHAGERTYEGSVDVSGTMSAGTSIRREQVPLADTYLTWPYPSTFFSEPAVLVQLNKAEIEERIMEEKNEYEKGQADPELRAKYLNMAIKQGLTKAALDANIDVSKMAVGLHYYGGGTATLMAVQLGVPWLFGIPPENIFLWATSDLTALSVMGPQLLEYMISREAPPEWYSKNKKSFQKELRKSVVVGCSLEKYVAARGLIKFSNVIKAQE